MKMNYFILLLILLLTSGIDVNAQYHWEWGRCMQARAKSPLSGTEGYVIAADHAGHIYASGQSVDSTASFGVYSFLNPGSSIAEPFSFLVKYDTSGNLIWAKYYWGGTGTTISCVTIDSVGNIVLAGVYASTSTVHFGLDSLPVSNIVNSFIVKVDSMGNTLWAKHIDSTGWLWPAVTIDNTNNILFAGAMNGTYGIYGHDTLYNHHPSGSLDVLVLKMDQNGNILWGRNAGGRSLPLWGVGDLATSVSSDGAGDVFLGGLLTSDTVYFETNRIITSYAHGHSEEHSFIAKYNAAGHLLWVKTTFGVDSGSSSGSTLANGDRCGAVLADPYGNVYLSGGFAGHHISIDHETVYNRAEGSYDVYLAKLNDVGDPIWLKGFGGRGNEQTWSLAFDSLYTHIWLSGQMDGRFAIFGSDTVFKTDTIPGGVSDPLFITRCDSGGDVVFATSCRAGGDDFATMTTDAIGNVYVCADYLQSPIDPCIFANDTMDYITGQDENFFVAKLAGPWHLPTTSVSPSMISEFHAMVFPNPASDRISITYFGVKQTAAVNICICDLTGRIVKNVGQRQLESLKGPIEISVNDLGVGIYFVKIIDEQGNRSVQKFTKVK